MTPFFDDERENRSADPSNPSHEHSSEGSPDEAMDPNRLAALIEGRLSEEDRQELVAAIGPAEAAGVLADAMAALADVDETATRGVSNRRWHPGVWLALAACVAGVLLFPVAWLRTHRAPNLGPEQYADLLVTHGVQPPADWNDTPWDVTRGPETLTAEARAFRIGVRLTDLGVAVRQHDSTAIRRAAEIAGLLDQSPGAAPLATEFRSIAAGGGDARVARVDSAARATRALPDAGYTLYGAWIEAARLAANAHDTKFFTLQLRAPHGDSIWARLPAGVQQAIVHVNQPHRPPTREVWDRLRDSLSVVAAAEGQ